MLNCFYRLSTIIDRHIPELSALASFLYNKRIVTETVTVTGSVTVTI